jgi:hypothetical protein
MVRAFLLGALLSWCSWAVAGLVPAAQAQDKPAKKDAKDTKDADKDKKAEGIKRSKTHYWTTVRGRIKLVGDDTLTLEVDVRGKKQELELVIAEDAKIRMPVVLDYDEKGRPKPIKRDKSDTDSKLGGIKGKKEDLAEGQMAEVGIGKVTKKKKDTLVATIIKVYEEKK